MAIAAEKILYIDPTSCIINCHRAMEFAIKWMYSVDASLTMPYQDNLISLMSTEEFRDIIVENLQIFFDFVCYCYADEYEGHTFDKALLVKDETAPIKKISRM